MSSNTVPSTRRVSCSTKGSRIVPGGGVGGREGRISEPIGEPETEHENSNSRVSSRVATYQAVPSCKAQAEPELVPVMNQPRLRVEAKNNHDLGHR